MAGEWPRATMDELKAVSPNAIAMGPFGSRIRTENFVPVGVPVIRGNNLNAERFLDDDFVYLTEEKANELRSANAFPLDIVVTHRGTLGQVGIIPPASKHPRYVVSQSQMKVTIDEGKADPFFVFYYLRSPEGQHQLLSNSSQTGVPAIASPTRALKSITVTYPPLPEQRAIAHVLRTLDDKIELNRRMNETLEVIARTTFKSWFLDFDPVRAKAEGRDAGLPGHIAALFPDSLEESELGEIPTGWNARRIEDVAERVGMGPFGSSIKVETFVAEGVPVISGQHLHGFMMDDNTFNFITFDHAERLKNANVGRGDVVFTHAGNIGQAAYIPENSRYERYVISQRQFFMRCDPEQVTPSFIALYFRSPAGQHQLLANASPSGVPSIARPVTYLRSIQLIIPPKPLIGAFEQLVQPMLLRFRWNLDESRALATLRDTLLPKLVSGELRVRDAGRFLEERGL
jgi:type I restriction enzyme S subunit